MVEEADPPFRSGIGKDTVEPFLLRRIAWMVAVQRDESGVAFVEAVVIAVVHVERLVVNLEIAIVVAERRAKFHAAIE